MKVTKQIMYDFKYTNNVTIYPLAGPHYLNRLNKLMAIRSSSIFFQLRLGAFHIALQTHKTQDTQQRGLKKRRANKHQLALVPSARREKLLLSVHLWAIVSMYSSEIPTQPLETLTHLLMLPNPASGFPGPSFSLSGRRSVTITFSQLLLTALFCWLPSSVHCPRTLLSLVFFRFRWRSHVQAFCVGFAQKQTKESDWHSPTPTPTETNTQHRATTRGFSKHPRKIKWIIV